MYKINEVINSGVIYYSSQEESFIKKVKQELNINVKMVDYSYRKINFTVTIYIDNDNTDSQVNKLLDKYAIPQMLGNYCYSYDKTPSNHMEYISRDIINLFFETFYLHKEDFDVITLYIYNFKRAVYSHAYGKAQEELKRMLKEAYPDYMFQVKHSPDPKIYILFPNSSDFTRFHKLYDLKEFKKQCFSIIKKYDKFDYLYQDTLTLEIYDKNKVTPENLNLDFRDWNIDYK